MEFGTVSAYSVYPMVPAFQAKVATSVFGRLEIKRYLVIVGLRGDREGVATVVWEIRGIVILVPTLY